MLKSFLESCRRKERNTRNICLLCLFIAIRLEAIASRLEAFSHVQSDVSLQVWINSNMQSHESFRKCVGRQKAVEVIELPHKRVGLIGVLSNETNLYKPGAFGGATIDDPWETLAFYKKFLEKEKSKGFCIPIRLETIAIWLEAIAISSFLVFLVSLPCSFWSMRLSSCLHPFPFLTLVCPRS